jgi:hypothetical protein
MNAPSLPRAGPLAIDLNQPGTYLHWSIFTVSVANLALIAVMVVIFGAALLLPFPRGRAEAAVAPARPAPGLARRPLRHRSRSPRWRARMRGCGRAGCGASAGSEKR